MKTSSVYLLAVILVTISSVLSFGGCPCSDPSLCEPVSVEPRQEFLGFSVGNSSYLYYDYNVITTIGVFYPAQDIPADFLCKAHQNNVRLVTGGFFPVNQLGNTTAELEWIQGLVQTVQDYYLDGVNVDIEDPITDGPTAALMTGLVAMLYKTFKSINPNYQITLDAPWSPDCIDGRCYDFEGLSMATDFMVLMDYDMESQMFNYGPQCTARANSPPQMVSSGLQGFLELNIAPEKLLMGMPWYGYNYPCVNDDMTLNSTTCVIPWTLPPYRGDNCSDAAGSQLPYSEIMSFLQAPPSDLVISPVQWSSNYQAPWFNFQNTSDGSFHQIWFDNPTSLSVKINIAKSSNLRGLSVWNIDEVAADFSANTLGMWNAIATFYELEPSSEQKINVN